MRGSPNSHATGLSPVHKCFVRPPSASRVTLLLHQCASHCGQREDTSLRQHQIRLHRRAKRHSRGIGVFAGQNILPFASGSKYSLSIKRIARSRFARSRCVGSQKKVLRQRVTFHPASATILCGRASSRAGSTPSPENEERRLGCAPVHVKRSGHCANS